jgi:hypothetical protein
MRDLLKRYAWWTYVGLFYNQSPGVVPSFKPFYVR